MGILNFLQTRLQLQTEDFDDTINMTYYVKKESFYGRYHF